MVYQDKGPTKSIVSGMPFVLGLRARMYTGDLRIRPTIRINYLYVGTVSYSEYVSNDRV